MYRTPIGGAALALALLISHRPAAVFHPQLWAEEGGYFADAYNVGASSVLWPTTAGYLVVVPRFVAWVAAATLPIPAVPTLFVAVALACQLAPVVFLLSAAGRAIVPSTALRVGLAGLLVAVPDWELHANLTNAQWHLAVVAGLLLIAPPPRTHRGRILSAATLVACGLTGPFVFALVVLAACRVAENRAARWWRLVFALTVTLALVQGLVLAVGSSRRASVPPVVAAPDAPPCPGIPSRFHPPLGASPARLVYLLADRVILPAATGREGNVAVNLFAVRRGGLALALVLATTAAGIAFAVRAPRPARLVALYGGLLLVGALLKPIGAGHDSQWRWLVAETGGNRYFFLPVLALIVVFGWVVSVIRPPWLRTTIAGVAGAVFLAGVAASWRYPVFPAAPLGPALAELAAAPPGTLVPVPILPPGWVMCLRAGARPPS